MVTVSERKRRAGVLYSKIQVIRKLLIGAAALAVAICITIFIRENMDVNDPERALPSITITMNGTTAMAPEMIFRAGYEWNFLTTTAKSTPPYSSQDLQAHTPPVEMLARTYMDIDFSLEPRSLTISRSDEENFEAFLDLVGRGRRPHHRPRHAGRLHVPHPGGLRLARLHRLLLPHPGAGGRLRDTSVFGRGAAPRPFFKRRHGTWQRRSRPSRCLNFCPAARRTVTRAATAR